MDFQGELNRLQQQVEQAKEILILTKANPSLDGLAAALALYLAFPQIGKRAVVACPTPATVEFSNLIAVNKVANTLANKNFVISFDYAEGSIEKVSYNIENNKFNLIIEPSPGAPVFSTDKVNYSYSGLRADLIILINTQSLTDLAQFYNQNRSLFEEKFTISIDHESQNRRFAQLNIVNQQAISTCEIVTLLLKNMNIRVDQDIATNLLIGITDASNNFSLPNVSAWTFEAASICLRAGARRLQFAKKEAVTKTVSPLANFGQTSTPAFQFQPKIAQSQTPLPNFIEGKNVTKVPSGDQKQKTSVPQQVSESEKKDFIKKAQINKETDKKDTESQKQRDASQAPPDWLKPKIYKGSTLL